MKLPSYKAVFVMFGNKKSNDQTPKVPVYTVDTVPEKYKIIGMVQATNENHPTWDNNRVIAELGKAGADIGADAVIGLTFHVGIKILYAYGTAIKYEAEGV
jgi:hypothetical protein